MKKSLAHYKKTYKLSEIAANVIYVVCAILFIWAFISFCDIITHNMSDGIFWKYNLIVLAFGS